MVEVPQTPSKAAVWLRRGRETGLVLLRFISGGLFRISLIAAGLMLAAYLLYVFAIAPLQLVVEVPAGISARSPEVDTGKLKDLNNKRIERSEYRPKPYAVYDRLFTGSQ